MPSRTPARVPSHPRLTARLSALPLEDRITPAVAYALSGTGLMSFDTANPTIAQTTPITNINAGETLVGIDFRPQNGLLYGLGVNAGANTGTLYAISVRTGVAGAVGTAGGIAFQDGPGNPIDLPDPATVGYGFDFNPAADRVRVVTASGLNFRVNPNTGASVDGDLGGAAGSVANVNPDGAISGGTTTVDATAYTNSQPNNGNITTQYTLDAVGNQLFIQNPPNGGTQTTATTVTLGGNSLDFTAIGGFDIPAGVNAPASNSPVAAGSAFAVLAVGGTTGLYSINLVNGQATLVGNVGTAATVVSGLAVQSDLGGFPAVSLNAAGDAILRFNTATPGTTTTVNITSGLVSGETLVAIDYRPATGQLYALGVDHTADTATLYLLSPQNVTGGVESAFLTVVGTASQITFAGTDFPDPTTAGYGFDFNPDVDRVRVTTSTGLNFRVNPNTGAGVDSDGNGGNGTTPDAAINGLPAGSAGVSGTAYTNSFGNDVAVTATTQYTLDAASDRLFIQTPPNNGTQTNPLPITLGGSSLDFTDVSGFDIPAGVLVTSSGTAVGAGRGFAALTVGGTTNLYSINLTTGAATLVGGVGAGATQLAGLALGDAPAGAVSFLAATDSVHEENGPLAVTLTRTSTNGTASVTVTPVVGTAGGTDLTLAPLVATFGDGSATATVFVPITNDPDDEPDETFTLTLSNPTNGLVVGAPAVSAVTILDEDLPPGAASFDSATSTVNEGAGTLAVTLTRPPGSAAGTVTIQFAAGTAGGSDYTATPILVNFAAGQTMATVNVPITDDAADEPDETFILRLVSPTGGVLVGATDEATATITDDDVAPLPPSPPPPPAPIPTARPKMVVANGTVLTVTKADGSTTVLDPFPGFAGGFTVATGDVNGDGVADAIAGARAGGGSHVKVFDGATGALIRSFFAYDGFGGGVAVASGDVNGDGFDDIVTGAGIDGATGNGHVKVFDGRTGALLQSFFAYPGFGGGVAVASGDVNGDGFDDIVTGASANGHVKVFSGADGSLLHSFFAYPGFLGGVFVAAGDLDGDGRAEVVTGAGAGAGPHVKAFSGADGSLLASFFAYDAGFFGGVRVGVSDVNGDGTHDIVTGPGPGGGPNVRAFALNGTLLSSGLAGSAATGVFVG